MGNRTICAWVLTALLATASLPGQAQTANIADGAEGSGQTTGTFFVLASVNGEEIKDNAITASQRASAGRGLGLLAVGVNRSVPAGKLTIRLQARQASAAPVAMLWRALLSENVDFGGTLQVELQAGRQYRVNGIVDPYKRELWLEDAQTLQVIGEKIQAPANPELLKLMEGAQYLCCNLRYEGNWISDTPWGQYPFVPAGARIKVVDVGRNSADVLIDGRKMKLGNDWGRGLETMQQLVDRVVLPADPRERIRAYDPAVRDAIQAGRAAQGMTREQVLVALGRPRLAHTPDLMVSEWLYLVGRDEEAFIVFGADGRVQTFDGSRRARGFLWQAPPATAAVAASAPASAASASR